MRKEHGFPIKLMLMNSFSTSDDTLAFLKSKYPELASEEGLEMLQNKVPKLDAETLEVCDMRNHDICFVIKYSQTSHLFFFLFEMLACRLRIQPLQRMVPSWPRYVAFPTIRLAIQTTTHRLCSSPGDLYAALVGSGRLDELLDSGYKYMFVSNSDNLGASLDLGILTYFAQKELPFMMECCERTENDKKGGHLAVRNKDKQLVLRESAMCADEDEDAFKDITKHRFFNTNNLWIRLDRLKETIEEWRFHSLAHDQEQKDCRSEGRLIPKGCPT